MPPAPLAVVSVPAHGTGWPPGDISHDMPNHGGRPGSNQPSPVTRARHLVEQGSGLLGVGDLGGRRALAREELPGGYPAPGQPACR